ncbi:hypothetical protein [Nocardia sp. NPDC050710]|uniref:hypothetical protein n=1 Tax=Nocardia sp. NPDC050710 TaxID=3157220 RepID=UPI0033C0813C
MRPTDGRVITNPENAQNFSHAEIRQAADRMNPDGLAGAFAAWAAIAAAVTKAGQQFESAIHKAVDQRWEGAAAEAAVLGIREYATRVGELGDSLNQQSGPLSAAGSAAARFKAAIPEVPDGSQGSTPEQRNSQEEQARDDMVTYYIQPYGSTAPEIPTLPAPINPTATSPVDNVVGTGPGIRPGVTEPAPTSDGTDPNTGGPSKPTDAGEPGKGIPSEEAAPSDAGSGDATENPDAPDGQDEPGVQDKPEPVTPQSVSPTSGNGATTTPSTVTHTPGTYSPSTIATPQTTPTAVTPSSVNGIPSRPDTPASINPGATPNQSSQPRPGASVPAQPAAQSAPAAPAATPGRPGIPGAPGYAGMMPPGARARDEEDGEHKSPRYLRTEEHATELIGEVKPTVPPVIGAE